MDYRKISINEKWKIEVVVDNGLQTGYTCALIGEDTGIDISAVGIPSHAEWAIETGLQAEAYGFGLQPAIGRCSGLTLQGVGSEWSAVGVLDPNECVANAQHLYDQGLALQLNNIANQQLTIAPYHHQLLHSADAPWFAAGAINPTA